MSEQHIPTPVQAPANLSAGTAYSPETDLPNAIMASRWARACWAKKHPKGPYCVVFRMFPLNVYIAGWIPFAGSKCIPRLVDCVREDEPWAVDSAVSDLGQKVFALGPADHMVEHSRAIAAKYAANGEKGGRPRKSRKAAAASSEDKSYPKKFVRKRKLTPR
jgi:hypothetical protein